MTKNTGIRKTIELLLKKVETLENQSFAQKLQIDELENKLQRTEETLKQVQENPFGLAPISVPSVWPAPSQQPNPLLAPYIPSQPLYPGVFHVCSPGPTDWTGGCYCATCGAQMGGPTWTITSTSDSTEFCLADTSAQSSSDVEPVLDLDISWIVPEDFNKKD